MQNQAKLCRVKFKPKKSKILWRNLRKKMLVKKWISAAKTSKKHNLQKWYLFSSISNSFRDISNSLNSPLSHVVKITSQIHVYLEPMKSQFWGEICAKKCLSKKWISAAKTSKKHNLQKWNLYSCISNSFRYISNSLNTPVSHVVKIIWQIHVYLKI